MGGQSLITFLAYNMYTCTVLPPQPGVPLHPALVCHFTLPWCATSPCPGLSLHSALLCHFTLLWCATLPCPGLSLHPALVCHFTLPWCATSPYPGVSLHPALVLIYQQRHNTSPFSIVLALLIATCYIIVVSLVSRAK